MTAAEQNEARNVLKRVAALSVQDMPTDEQLEAIRALVCTFARSAVWESSSFREANAGEELVYELATMPPSGSALYLVSDGALVASPPHCHQTWSAIVGIRGCEINHLYTLEPGGGGTVAWSRQVRVDRESFLVLGAEDIHSTEVSGSRATYHLHLYGRALHELPDFASRCYPSRRSE